MDPSHPSSPSRPGDSLPDTIGKRVDPEYAKELTTKVRDLLDIQHDCFPGSQPVSFERRHLEDLEHEDYFVCEKSDGVRYLLFFHHTQRGPASFMYDRNRAWFHIPNLAFPKRGPEKECLKDTLMDGELVVHKDNDKMSWRFLVFDLMTLNNTRVTQRSFNTRLGMLQQDVLQPFNNSLKHVSEPPPFMIELKKMERAYGLHLVFDQMTKLKHNSDGVVWTPVKYPYKSGLCEKLLKWKPPEKYTVDFRISASWSKEHKPIYTLEVLSHGVNYKFYDHFQPKPALATEWKKKLPDGCIAEFRYDPTLNVTIVDQGYAPTTRKGGWSFIRFRDDKDTANEEGVVKNIEKSIHDGVTKEELIAHMDRVRRAWKAREKGLPPPQYPPAKPSEQTAAFEGTHPQATPTSATSSATSTSSSTANHATSLRDPSKEFENTIQSRQGSLDMTNVPERTRSEGDVTTNSEIKASGRRESVASVDSVKSQPEGKHKREVSVANEKTERKRSRSEKMGSDSSVQKEEEAVGNEPMEPRADSNKVESRTMEIDSPSTSAQDLPDTPQRAIDTLKKKTATTGNAPAETSLPYVSRRRRMSSASSMNEADPPLYIHPSAKQSLLVNERRPRMPKGGTSPTVTQLQTPLPGDPPMPLIAPRPPTQTHYSPLNPERSRQASTYEARAPSLAAPTMHRHQRLDSRTSAPEMARPTHPSAEKPRHGSSSSIHSLLTTTIDPVLNSPKSRSPSIVDDSRRIPERQPRAFDPKRPPPPLQRSSYEMELQADPQRTMYARGSPSSSSSSAPTVQFINYHGEGRPLPNTPPTRHEPAYTRRPDSYGRPNRPWPSPTTGAVPHHHPSHESTASPVTTIDARTGCSVSVWKASSGKSSASALQPTPSTAVYESPALHASHPHHPHPHYRHAPHPPSPYAPHPSYAARPPAHPHATFPSSSPPPQRNNAPTNGGDAAAAGFSRRPAHTNHDAQPPKDSSHTPKRSNSKAALDFILN